MKTPTRRKNGSQVHGVTRCKHHYRALVRPVDDRGMGRDGELGTVRQFGRDVGSGDDRTAVTATHYGWVEIPWFPASMPKLLSRRVYSAPLALDVSAPSEPGGWCAVGVKQDRLRCEEGKIRGRKRGRGMGSKKKSKNNKIKTVAVV